jgi:hypothetical protein
VRLRNGKLEEAISDFKVAASLEPIKVNFISNLDDAASLASNPEGTMKISTLLSLTDHRIGNSAPELG